MTVNSLDPSVALWTPQGRGAVATIRVSGDLTSLIGVGSSIPFHPVNRKPLDAQPLGRVVFGTWGVEFSEEVVLCRISNAELEIHCHGGVAAARRIMADWQGLGVLSVSWREQSARGTGELAAQCREAVSNATTLRTASILLDQESAWQAFSNNAVRWARSGDWGTLKISISEALNWQELGRHLLDPFFVVLTGPPNVGKSALLNALVGYQRSVVFDQPGTTRDVVTAETAVDGWPVRLIDTAGLRDDAIGLEAAGIELAHQQLGQADLVLQVSDASVHSAGQADWVVSRVPMISIANKIDLVDVPESISEVFPSGLAVSALTGVGVDVLVRHIAERLVPRIPARGCLIPFHEGQVNWLLQLQAAADAESVIEVEATLAQWG